jgi:hypothetical protein
LHAPASARNVRARNYFPRARKGCIARNFQCAFAPSIHARWATQQTAGKSPHPARHIFPTTSPPPLICTPPPSHRVGSPGFCSIHDRENGTFTPRSMREATACRSGAGRACTVRAYNDAAWRLCRLLRDINFDDVSCREEVEMFASEPRLLIRE